MKRWRILLTMFAILCIFSCEDAADFDCDECLTEKPGAGELKIKVTINAENPKVPVTIYFNDIDDHVIYKDTVDTAEFYFEGPVKHYYAVEAKYQVGEDTIYVIDGDYMKPEKSSSCEEECWIVKGDVFDVRLKYD